MLEPALVLDAGLTVRDALAELDRYASFGQVVVRLDVGDGGLRWFAMAAYRLRWLLQDAEGGETLERALDLREAEPSPVLALGARSIDGFRGVVLDDDEVVGVSAAEAAEADDVAMHRGARPNIPPAAPPPPPPAKPRAAAAPAPPPPPAPSPAAGAGVEADVAAPGGGAAAPDAVVVPVLFATDRAPSGNASPAKFFGSERGPLRFGVADVSIPARHDRGHLESPTWWKFEFRPDTARHVVLDNIVLAERDAFSESGRRDVLVFVHGYNVSFANAARRTAQIAHDLSFRGAPMLYSWPSCDGTLRYFEDETNARWTVPHFDEFLTLIRSELDATAVHVIAHSMGNRVLAECVRTHNPPAPAAQLRQIVLAAPDIDADTFATLAREFQVRAERVTLYASSRDLALKASKLVHGYPRAGDSEPLLAIADGIDTIDASRVDTNLLGHSYVGDAGSILADVNDLLDRGEPPIERRFHLEAREQAGKRYWLFRP